MSMQSRWKYILVLLCLSVWVILIALFTFPSKNLRLIACDVGQGDSILAIYGKTQILVDGGPDAKVLGCLSRHLPFWDRKIEVVVNSHPQKDHFAGLIDVLKTYAVETFVATPLDSGSQDWQVLKSLVGSKGIKVVNPVSGQSIRIGLIYLDILWPSKESFLATENSMHTSGDISGRASQSGSGVLGAFATKEDPNKFSVVAVLRFKNFDALLTGDIGTEISDVVAQELMNKSKRPIEYIKVPHHGSKNGLTRSLLETAQSEVAVISVGKNNSYGHPHEEVLKMLQDEEIKILRTDQLGDIAVESDGKQVILKD